MTNGIPTQRTSNAKSVHHANSRNKVTSIIKERKNAYFNDIYALGRDDPKKMWSEIKRLAPGKNKHLHITCDISANDFNHHLPILATK